MPKKPIDLTGQQFGELTVLERDLSKPSGNGHHVYWICQCSCGKILSVSSTKLRNENQKSCGHLQLNKRPDIIGKIFNNLTVLDYDFSLKDFDGKYYYRCQCKCGKIVSRTYSSLTSTKYSCCDECKKEIFHNQFSGLTKEELEQRTGRRFGKLVVLERTNKQHCNNGEKYYLCQCDCGNITLARWSDLINGTKSSCGCLKSKGELKVQRILEENNLKFIGQYTFEDLVSNKGRHLKFDFAIFDEKNNLQYLIEYQGEQHYRKESRFYDEEAQIRDNQKRQYCKKHGIKLIEIPYTDYHILNMNYIQERFQ